MKFALGIGAVALAVIAALIARGVIPMINPSLVMPIMVVAAMVAIPVLAKRRAR